MKTCNIHLITLYELYTTQTTSIVDIKMSMADAALKQCEENLNAAVQY